MTPRPTAAARGIRRSSWLLALSLLASTACTGADSEKRAPIASAAVIGVEAEGIPLAVAGRVLLGELGCVACHDSGDVEIEAAAGPRLTDVARRVEPGFLVEFLTSPGHRQPGTVMPDLLADHSLEQATERARSIVHYLRSLTKPAPERSALDPAAVTRGEQIYARIGCRECHTAGADLAHLTDKYSTTSLTEILLRPHLSRPSRRMPDFALSPAQAHDLSHFLLAGRGPAATGAVEPIDPRRVTAGRDLVASLRCGTCHEIDDPQAIAAPLSRPKPLHAVSTTAGCLSEQVGAWPRYTLTEAQRTAIRAALASLAEPLTAQQTTLQMLASRRCIVCHRRDDVDLVATAVARGHFATNDPSLGQEGSIPPPLTGVGAKLQPAWLANTIARGQNERDYLAVRMPGFGETFAARLAQRLADVDRLPPIEIATLPNDDKAAEAVREVGRTLVGDKGMNCITCHRFAGIQAGSMGAIDLAYTTKDRLRPEWFAHFLRAPFRFKPATLMPQFFPDGKSTRPEVAEGDVARQIDGIWHYLAAGRNVRAPSGLHPPPIEITVGDEAVILRRSVQGTGKRAIAVGLPGGVNLTFDAEGLGMNQIWWGRFLDARPVWTSQGSGEAHILTRDPIRLPNGPAIVALERPDQDWPVATRRERNDRWLGYALDSMRRPTLRYSADDVTIEDAPREKITEGATRLERSIRVQGERSLVWLRAAVGEDLTLADPNTVHVGSRVAMHCATTPWLLVPVPDSKASEARLPLPCSTTGSTTTIEYRSLEQNK